MKARQILLSLIAIAIMAPACFAKQPAAKSSPPAKDKKAASKGLYLCPKCRIANDKGGKCPVCDSEMPKLKANMCPKCGPISQSDKAGNCTKCKTAMKSSKELLAQHMQECPNCKTMITKRSSCAVCIKAAKRKKV